MSALSLVVAVVSWLGAPLIGVPGNDGRSHEAEIFLGNFISHVDEARRPSFRRLDSKQFYCGCGEMDAATHCKTIACDRNNRDLHEIDCFSDAFYLVFRNTNTDILDNFVAREHQIAKRALSESACFGDCAVLALHGVIGRIYANCRRKYFGMDKNIGRNRSPYVLQFESDRYIESVQVVVQTASWGHLHLDPRSLLGNERLSQKRVRFICGIGLSGCVLCAPLCVNKSVRSSFCLPPRKVSRSGSGDSRHSNQAQTYPSQPILTASVLGGVFCRFRRPNLLTEIIAFFLFVGIWCSLAVGGFVVAKRRKLGIAIISTGFIGLLIAAYEITIGAC